MILDDEGKDDSDSKDYDVMIDKLVERFLENLNSLEFEKFKGIPLDEQRDQLIEAREEICERLGVENDINIIMIVIVSVVGVDLLLNIALILCGLRCCGRRSNNSKMNTKPKRGTDYLRN